jgi:hypothetical protein
VSQLSATNALGHDDKTGYAEWLAMAIQQAVQLLCARGNVLMKLLESTPDSLMRVDLVEC